MKAGKETEMYNQGYMNGYNDGANARIDPDYWTRLEHTYAGMFMKSFLDNFDGTTSMEILADDAIELAHALVEKMKEEK